MVMIMHEQRAGTPVMFAHFLSVLCPKNLGNLYPFPKCHVHLVGITFRDLRFTASRHYLSDVTRGLACAFGKGSKEVNNKDCEFSQPFKFRMSSKFFYRRTHWCTPLL